MVNQLLIRILDLVRFRSGPQDLPYAPPLAIGLVLAQMLVVLYRAQHAVAAGDVMPAVLVSGVFALVSTWVVLRLRELQGRYWQTLLALAGVGLLFSLLLLVMVLVVGPIDPEAPPALAPVFGWVALLIMAWQILVMGHIWRNALNLLFPVGVLVAVALLLVEGVILLSLFPRAAQ